MGLIYFTRHGENQNNELSEIGIKNIKQKGVVLNCFQCKPTIVFSSPTMYCTQTAQILAPDAPVLTRTILSTIGKIQKLHKPAKAFIDECICPLKEEIDIIVVCHGSMASALAIALIEKRSGTVNLDDLPSHVQYPAYGSGVLVDGTTRTQFM